MIWKVLKRLLKRRRYKFAVGRLPKCGPAREILAQATECGLSIATLRRAKAVAGVTAERIEFEAGKAHWNWSLDGIRVKNGDCDGAIEIARIYAKG